MLRKVEVTHSGDSHLIRGEQLEYTQIREINAALLAEDAPANSAHIVGHYQNLLGLRSFISAASFRNYSVLTEAAVTGKKDYLRGLKENVVVGRLSLQVLADLSRDRKRQREEELAAGERETATADETEQALSEALAAQGSD